jgi:starch-binding outer membrane protein, SusD/RagB family
MSHGNTRGARSHWAALLAAPLVALSLSACDLEVTNPGPFQDQDLDNIEAHESIVNGMKRRVARIVNWGAFKTAGISKEVTPAGIGLTYGYSASELRGRLISDGQSTRWAEAQRARWVSENGVERLREVLEGDFASSPNSAWALVYAGYSNRMLGELWCWTVIDGGEPQPSTHSLERAESYFSEAIQLAEGQGLTEAVHAARAGRASVRMWRGDWSGAVADTEAVPTDFVYDSPMDPERIGWHNLLYFASANTPYRVHSLWDTFFGDYYAETGDPRVAWVADDDVPNMQPGEGGALFPWYFQQKFRGVADNINLSSGREMRLIVAESHLAQGGDWQSAMQIINALRADVGVEPWDVDNLEDAWTALKRERGIELWGEARRMGDLRRWELANTPGEHEDVSARDLCFPIGMSEIDTNPNVTEDWQHTEADPPAR